MIRWATDLMVWVTNLFNPPPLSSLTIVQRTFRVILLTTTLVVGSILAAMVGAVGLFVLEKGRELGSTPELLNGVVIVAIGISVNAACVYVLVHLKVIDNRIVPAPESAGDPSVKHLKIKPDQLGALPSDPSIKTSTGPGVKP